MLNIQQQYQINRQQPSQNAHVQQHLSFKNSPYYGSYGTEGASDSAAKTLGSAALLQIIAMSLQTLSQWCSAKLMQGKAFAENDIARNIAKDMAVKNNLKVTLGYVDEANKYMFEQRYNSPGAFNEVARGANAFFNSKLNLAVAPKSKPYLILHEIGHAINSTKGPVMRFLQNSRFKLASLPTALLITNMFMPKSPKDGETFIERNAGKIGFAAFLPTIIEEGLASLRGIKAAKQAKAVYGNKINLAPLKKNYFFAWMTYVISGLLLGVGMKQTMLENK